MKTKVQILSENPDLRSYRVMLYEEAGDQDFQLTFDCYAEDDEHSAEQALNAYPNGVVISTTPDMGNDYDQT